MIVVSGHCVCVAVRARLVRNVSKLSGRRTTHLHGISYQQFIAVAEVVDTLHGRLITIR
jgi:hypothetical protein